ncbi:MAG: MFS transporter [Pseudobdellovibrionaceae bacterium]
MKQKAVILAVTVAALGYFVDIYDLLLFSIVRVASLRGIGVPDDRLMEMGVLLINYQMAGLLVGGVAWGILGDKKGRLSVLFGSILIYSVANILNGFVHSVEAYAALRFIAGFGLAGELGAGITLVAELMPQDKRGYGTSIVAAFGILGAVLAGLIGDFFDWRTSYIIGGVMGLLLLVLRIGVSESGLFKDLHNKDVAKGNFFAIFKQRDQFLKYLCVILVGVPIWYLIGIPITFSPEFGKAFNMIDLPSAGKAVLFTYLGLSIGDLGTGLLSQWLKSRKKVILTAIISLAILVVVYFQIAGQSLFTYYFMCVLLGISAGYWAMFVTVASEQFGTNIRATVTTSAPNFVRGSVIPLTLAFQALQGTVGIINSALIVGAVAFGIALLALRGLEETFHKNLDYVEKH